MAIIAFTLSVVGRGMARALVIDPTFGVSITSDPNVAVIEAGIDATIQRVEADIANPITVTIDFQEMTTGLGLSQTTNPTPPTARGWRITRSFRRMTRPLSPRFRTRRPIRSRGTPPTPV